VDKIYIITEDDVRVTEGDVVYNYYDMRPVVIEMRPRDAKDIEEIIESGNGSLKRDVWLEMKAKDAEGNIIGTDLLNGERICSMAFAKVRGFRGA
jgi:hypothetical protein